MGQNIIPQSIIAELRKLRADVDRIARIGGYGANKAAVDAQNVVYAESPQTLKNKTISGADNFISKIPISALPGAVVYTDNAPVDDITHDEDISADIIQFFPGMADASGQLVFGNSQLGGHYRKQGKHVWFKLFFQAGTTFFGGSGTLSLQIPWVCPTAYNQPLHLHFFQQTTAYGQLHWHGVAEFIQGTNKLNLLLPFNQDSSVIGRMDEGVGAVPYPGPGGSGWQVISPGSKLWVSGDIFVA
jgi:hypothetical protein